MSFKNAYDSAGLNKDTEKKLKNLDPKKSSSVKGVAGGSQVEPVPSYIKADSEKARPGCMDNLIFEVFTKNTENGNKERAGKKDQRIFFGVLPAVPIEIIHP